MADSFIQVAPDSTGKLVDNTSLTVNAQTVQRQRINITDPATAAAIATVVNAAPSGNYGLTVWLNTSQLPATVNGGLPASLVTSTADVGKVRFSIPTTSALTQAVVNVNGSGDNTIVAGVAAQTVRVFRLMLVFTGAVGAEFKDGAATAITGIMQMTTGGSIVLDLAGEPWYVTSSGNAFILNLSAGVQVSGTIWYTQS